MFIVKNLGNMYVENLFDSPLVEFPLLVANDIKLLCNQSMIRGNCDQQIPRWYFNPNDQYCHPYQYTGCRKFERIFFLFKNITCSFLSKTEGNANSFEVEQDCRDICQAKEKGRLKNFPEKTNPIRSSLFVRYLYIRKRSRHM